MHNNTPLVWVVISICICMYKYVNVCLLKCFVLWLNNQTSLISSHLWIWEGVVPTMYMYLYVLLYIYVHM